MHAGDVSPSPSPPTHQGSATHQHGRNQIHPLSTSFFGDLHPTHCCLIIIHLSTDRHRIDSTKPRWESTTANKYCVGVGVISADLDPAASLCSSQPLPPRSCPPRLRHFAVYLLRHVSFHPLCTADNQLLVGTPPTHGYAPPMSLPAGPPLAGNVAQSKLTPPAGRTTR